MPELPEVETIRKQLHARLAGKKITGAVLLKSGREKPVGKKFIDLLVGKKLLAVRRRAKILLFDLSDEIVIHGHLKMTGKFTFVSLKYVPTKHDRLILKLGNQAVVWSDVRMFGYLHGHSPVSSMKLLEKYGPEPLETSVAELAQRIVLPKTRTIKAALLNQEVIAGVGNIYADEACYRAGIRPTRRLGTLSTKDRITLMREVQKILILSIKQKGTSANDYVDTDGAKGGFQNLLRVYGRGGQPCKKCQSMIKKIVLAGRGTHYCPTCQS